MIPVVQEQPVSISRGVESCRRIQNRNFEDHIEAHLNQSGYRSLQSSHYNKSRCLISNETLRFIQMTQLPEYQKLERQYDADTPDKLLDRVSRDRLKIAGYWTCFGKALGIEVVILI